MRGKRRLILTVPLDHIPVFVKGNSFYVTGKMLEGNSKLWKNGGGERRLNIYAFPGKTEEVVTFDYIDYEDNNKEKNFVMSKGNDIIEITSPPLSTETVYIIKTDIGPKEVAVNGEKIKWEWDNAYGTVIIHLKKGKGINLQIRN